MSSSIRRSSREELEETDEMLIEPIPKKYERDQDDSGSEEVEDTDERQNDYEYDGFVVPDDMEDDTGTDLMKETDTESRRRRRRRRRRQNDDSLEKDDIDLLNGNLGTSTDRYRRLKKGRNQDTEDDDIHEEDEASLSSSYQRERKDQSYYDMKLLNQIFHGDTEVEDQEAVDRS